MHYKKILRSFASPKFVVYTIPMLMVLLILGTIAQKYIGLYEAQNIFFSSFFIWLWGFIPLPGGYIITGLILISLTIKLFMYSRYSFENSGTIIAHLGVCILLFGGIFTAIYSQEGYVNLTAKEYIDDSNNFLYTNKTNIMSDYHDREFVVIKNGNDIININFNNLSKDKEIKIDNNISFKIIDYCRNCDIIEARYVNMMMKQDASRINLKLKKKELEDEENLSGATFELITNDENIAGIYITFEQMVRSTKINIDKNEYKFAMRKVQRKMPFDIELIRFDTIFYPGTQTAKSYSSNVVIKDDNIEWPAIIEMNEPLRYKGYTIYQASYMQNNDVITSVLSVVENKGAIFPYIACIVMSLGIFLHILIRFKKIYD